MDNETSGSRAFCSETAFFLKPKNEFQNWKVLDSHVWTKYYELPFWGEQLFQRYVLREIRFRSTKSFSIVKSFAKENFETDEISIIRTLKHSNGVWDKKQRNKIDCAPWVSCDSFNRVFFYKNRNVNFICGAERLPKKYATTKIKCIWIWTKWC